MTTVTAHRGDSCRAPENTLAAIRLAIEAGADRIEVDVRLTRDGVPVLVHDADLRRTAGADVRVGEVDLEELGRHDVGSWFGGSFAGERVPTLAGLLELSGGTMLNLELKAAGDADELVAATIEAVRGAGRAEDVLLTSFDEEILRAAGSAAWPVARTGWIVAEKPTDLFARDVGVHIVAADLCSRALVEACHDRGRVLHVFTVNEPEEMRRFVSKGADSIITDRPGVLRDLLDSKRPAGGDRPGA